MKKISNRYLIEDQKGGGMSITYFTCDEMLNRRVVLKRLNDCYLAEKNIVKQFKNEAINQASIAHPNIAKVFDYIEEDNIGYIIMEYVDGTELKQLYKSGESNLNVLIDIFIQIIDGIGYLHKNEVYHRDIKPQNIMVDTNNNVKIIDFGLSKIGCEIRQETIGSFGTQGYMPPEILNDPIPNNYDERKRDAFSIGVTFFELLTEEKPYDTTFTNCKKISSYRKHSCN
jgi:serine/threonine-protein kinase